MRPHGRRFWNEQDDKRPGQGVSAPEAPTQDCYHKVPENGRVSTIVNGS
jgi:hypothetical protein